MAEPGAFSGLSGSCLVHCNGPVLGNSLPRVALKQAEAAVQLKVFITQLGSGSLIPIYLYPRWLQRILSWLPFAHMADTPVAIASGGSPGKLGVQILWGCRSPSGLGLRCEEADEASRRLRGG